MSIMVTGSFQTVKNEVDYFLNTIAPLAAPFPHVIGNHEATGDREQDNHAKHSSGNVYGAFDFRVSHFVALDTE